MLLIFLFGKWFIVLALAGVGFWLLSYLPRFITRILSTFWRLMQWMLGVAVGLFLIVGILKFAENASSFQNRKAESGRIAPPIVEEATEFTEQIYSHRLNWNDYQDNSYTATLSIPGSEVIAASQLRNSIPEITTLNEYDNLLLRLSQEASVNSYNLVIPELHRIRETKKLNPVEYANMIVSMVQSIPYYVIISNTCNPFSYQDPFLRDLLSTSPCEPNVKHGIKAPAEFLMNLKGDCDTRTLFLYGLLKQEGYDVVIFGSEKYKHSVLGINLPILAPNYKWVNNTKYYLWETTNTGFKPGYIQPTMSNTSFWNLNLN